MSRSSSSSVVRRALNRVLPKPPILSRRSAALIGWSGPTVADDDIPPPEVFTRLIPRHDARPAEWIKSNLGHPLLAPDGHMRKGTPAT
jgi:hypothetical protein